MLSPAERGIMSTPSTVLERVPLGFRGQRGHCVLHAGEETLGTDDVQEAAEFEGMPDEMRRPGDADPHSFLAEFARQLAQYPRRL